MFDCNFNWRLLSIFVILSFVDRPSYSQANIISEIVSFMKYEKSRKLHLDNIKTINSSVFPHADKKEIQEMFDYLSANQDVFLCIDDTLDLYNEEYYVKNLSIVGDNGLIYNFKKIDVDNNLFLQNITVTNFKSGFFVKGNVYVNFCDFSDFRFYCINATSKDNDVKIIFNNNYCHDASSRSEYGTCHILMCMNAHGEIKGNIAKNIGSSKDVGVSLFRIGDRDGKEKNPANRFEIAYNWIENISSSNTYDHHVGGLNAIAPAGSYMNVHHNYINGINGIGYDREAIYCKMDHSVVHHNYIINGGTGQGSICLKSSSTEVFKNFIECNVLQCIGIMAFGSEVYIHDNNISGFFKNGIRMWKNFSGTVSNNVIQLKCKSIIPKDFADSGTGGISIKKGNGKAIVKGNKISLDK